MGASKKSINERITYTYVDNMTCVENQQGSTEVLRQKFQSVHNGRFTKNLSFRFTLRENRYRKIKHTMKKCEIIIRAIRGMDSIYCNMKSPVKITLISLLVLVAVIFINGCYFVFCHQDKSMAKIQQGEDLNLYECCSIKQHEYEVQGRTRHCNSVRGYKQKNRENIAQVRE